MPSEKTLKQTLQQYTDIYRGIYKGLSKLFQRFGKIAILDFHSYNHRRGGPDAPPDDPTLNPEINIGTGTMDRKVEYMGYYRRNFDNDEMATL